jgi:DNA-binding transcriptional ArsR family regulator
VAAAVDVEDGAVDEAGFVAGQVADGGGDLFRCGRMAGTGTCLTRLTSRLILTWRLSDVSAQDEEAAVLDSVLEALANPHRREIVYTLGLQPCAISQLARMRGLSLPAIHKHIKILENAGLVSRRKTGRTTYLALNPQRLRLLQDWAGQFRTYWGSAQASFENYRSYLDNDTHHP